MKKLIILSIALLPAIALAQNLKKEKVPVQYMQLPKAPLDETFTSYSTTISAKRNLLRSALLTEEQVNRDYLTIPGFYRAAKGGHFHIEVIIDDFVYPKNKYESKTVTSKNKDGKETKTKKFWVEVDYAIPISLKVTDHKGNIIDESIISTVENVDTYKSKEGSNFNSVKNNWEKTKKSTFINIRKKALIKHFSISCLSSSVSSSIDCWILSLLFA